MADLSDQAIFEKVRTIIVEQTRRRGGRGGAGDLV